MKTREELKKYFDEQLLPELKELESKRKNTVFKILLLAAVLFIVFVLISILSFVVDNSGSLCGVVLCCPLPLFLVIFALGYGWLKKDYVKDYKQKVIQKIVKFIDPNLEYSHEKTIPRSTFVRSQMFLQTPERFSGEDYVSGVIGNTKIEFSEIHAEDKRETRDSEGRRRTHYVTIFKGIFFIADFNKNFSGRTLVLPDTAQKMFGSMLGSMLQSANFMRPPLIKLEDPEFEKFFVVYGDDQIQSRYILSTSLMNRITEFRKKTGRDIFISFLDNNIMVALPYKKDLFEPRLFRSIVDYSQVEEYFNDLQFVLSLVDELNLNTRIWSKQ